MDVDGDSKRSIGGSDSRDSKKSKYEYLYFPMYKRSTKRSSRSKPYRRASVPSAVRLASQSMRLARYGARNEAILKAAEKLQPYYAGSGMLRPETGARLAGRGAYWGKDLGAMAGGMIGGAADKFLGTSGISSIGQDLGGRLGDYGSDLIERRFKGRGAYTETVVNNKINNPVGNENGEIVLTNSEYLGNVRPDSNEFGSIFEIRINPGLSNSFPWLSQIAQYYQEYEFIQLIFEYRSTVTDGNTAASGEVLMVSNDNPNQSFFTDESQMRHHLGFVSSKVTSHCLHGVECDPEQRTGSKAEYVRSAQLIPSSYAEYDQCNFQLCTSGCAAGLQIGSLYVHYVVKLRKSILLGPPVPPLPTVEVKRPEYAGLSIKWRAGSAQLVTSMLGNVGTTQVQDATHLMGLASNPQDVEVFIHNTGNLVDNNIDIWFSLPDNEFYCEYVPDGTKFLVEAYFSFAAAAANTPISWSPIINGASLIEQYCFNDSRNENGVLTKWLIQANNDDDGAVRFKFNTAATTALNTGANHQISIREVPDFFSNANDI